MSVFESSLLPEKCQEIEKNPVDFLNKITVQLMKSIFENQEGSYDNAICLGYSALLIFIAENFTGPSLTKDIKDGPKILLSAFLPKNFKEDFQINGEDISHQVLFPELIWLPFYLFRKYSAPKVWIGRVALILQKCMTGPTETLQKIAINCLEGLELVLALKSFHQNVNYLNKMEEFRKSIDFDFELTGIMGKKTKFQQTSIAQLVLKVNSCASLKENNHAETNKISNEINSREVKLEDDTHILERPKLEQDNEIPPLTDIELCYLLIEADAIVDRASNETNDEKRIPLLQTILQCNPPYSVATCALFDKSYLEKKNSYTQQRAVLQLESIIEDFYKTEVDSYSRLRCFFIIDHLPIWEIRREMGLQMLMIGAARSASKIFIEHKMWDEFAMSCAITKEPEVAIEVLSKEEQTPLIVCILGEVKGDEKLLENAWELSKHKMSRCQRSLARLYLKDEKWADAAKSFDTALKLNALYPDCWFSLGCCRMNLEQYNEAIAAFQNCVSQRQDDAEAFSNLAISLIKVDKMQEAHKAISQAIRFNRNSVKMWENFIIISLNIDNINEALYGVEEVIKANNKWCNTQLMYEILQSVIEKKGDFQRFVDAMELISQNADCGFDFWSIYADIMENIKVYDRALEMRQTVIKTLEKDGKVTEEKQFERLVDAAEKLTKTAENVPDKQKGAMQRIRVLIKKYRDDFETNPNFSRLESLITNFK